MEKYEMVPIKTFLDALQVREIRNQCRLFMTNNTSEISLLRQLVWYFTTYRKENNQGGMTCFLFKINNKCCGFGLIRKSAQKYWITGGLKLTERGRGLGGILFKGLIKNTPSSDVWIELLESNFVANKLYRKLGFKQVGIKKTNEKKIIVMKLRKPD